MLKSAITNAGYKLTVLKNAETIRETVLENAIV